MNTSEILSAIDQEIARLEQARSLLQGVSATSSPFVIGKRRGRPLGKAAEKALAAKKKRVMSEDGRARIAAAQKARWAAQKAASKKAAKAAASPAVAKKTAVLAKPVVTRKVAVKKPALPKKSTGRKSRALSTKPLNTPEEAGVSEDAMPETTVNE